jgi:hypothetical protein
MTRAGAADLAAVAGPSRCLARGYSVALAAAEADIV